MALMGDNIGNSTDLVNGYLTGVTGFRLSAQSGLMLADVVNRIEQRLKAVGLSASAASRQAGLTEDAIRNMQRAMRSDARKGVSTRTISALAPILQTSVAWLLDGDGDETAKPTSATVPLVGYVGAGAVAHYYATGDGGLDDVPAPQNATPNTVAAEIRGESLGPLLDGWLVYWDEVRNPPTPDMIGQLCVVGLPDDRVLVKQLKASSAPGRFHLLSNTESPIFDAEVLWAAKVKSMSPR